MRQELYWSLALLLLTCLLSFGIHIPRLGFYWDDYASIYVHTDQGSQVFIDWTNGQGRPVAGYVLGLIWDTVGVNPTAWQVINVGLYAASVIIFWRVLRLLWSDQPTLTTLIALLFAVYPSYHLRPIIISFQLILSLVVLLISLWCGLWAIKQRQWRWAILAGLLAALHPLIYEQNLVYEALRPLVLLFLMYQLAPQVKWQSHLPTLLRLWLPQLLGGTVYLIYRLFLYQPNETYAAYNSASNLSSLEGILLTFKNTAAVPLKMLVFDWGYMPWRIFVEQKVDLDLPGLAACTLLLGGLLYLWRYPMQHPLKKQSNGLVCVVAICFMGGLLFLIYSVGNGLGDGFVSRWALSPSLLAALTIGLLLPLVLQSRLHSPVILLLLVVVGLMVQVGVSRLYVQDWQLRRDLWWQMVWRAPQLEPGTLVTLVLSDDPFAFHRSLNDYELTAHTNLFYGGSDYPSVVGAEPYVVQAIIANQWRRQGVWSEVVSNRNIIFRNWDFDLDKLLVFGYDGGCLKTADPTTVTQPMEALDFVNLAPYQHLEQITPIALAERDPSSFEQVITPEPAHSWCFYYQQVQWALEAGQLEQAVQLADQVLTQGLAPSDGQAVEWVPFIETYLQAGREAEVQTLLDKVRFGDAKAQDYLCARLDNLPQTPLTCPKNY